MVDVKRFRFVLQVILILSLLVVIPGCDQLLNALDEEENPGAIQGSIYNSSSGLLVTTMVTINTDEGQTTVTSNGSFRLDDVTAGQRVVYFSAQGYEYQNRTITVSANDTYILNVYLTPTTVGTATIYGTISEAGTGNRIYDEVTISTDNGISTTTTSGEYELTGVAVGTRTITASGPNYETFVTTVQVNANSQTQLAIILTPHSEDNAEIYGGVYDSISHEPLYGATVSASTGESVVTDNNGYYQFFVPAGTLELTARKSGYESTSQTVYASGGMQYEIEFYLSSGGTTSATVSGYVMDNSTSMAVSGAEVYSDDGSYTTTNSDGSYSLIVGEGTRTFYVWANGYYSTTEQFDVNGGEYYQHNFWLSPEGAGTGYVEGYAIDASTGYGIPNAYIYADNGAWTYADENGYYWLEISEGTHYIYGFADNYYDAYYSVYVVSGETSWLNIEFWSSSTSGTGIVEGYVIDAETGYALLNAHIETDDGFETWSDTTGFFSISVNSGERIFYVEYEGYYSSTETLYIEDNSYTWFNFVLSQEFVSSDARYRFVLTWGEDPYDLDSYLITPEIDGVSYVVYYGDPGMEDAPPYATLDVDDTDGYGPETMTIFEMEDGVYEFYVNRYAGVEAALAGCGANVKIYNEYGLVSEVTIPSYGEGDWWYVCSVQGDYVTIWNQIVDLETTSPSNEINHRDVKYKR